MSFELPQREMKTRSDFQASISVVGGGLEVEIYLFSCYPLVQIVEKGQNILPLTERDRFSRNLVNSVPNKDFKGAQVNETNT
ncbi:MAG: hypothetical protein ACFFFG_12720 [Candidatus Thorarchaeota archaeon]